MKKVIGYAVSIVGLFVLVVAVGFFKLNIAYYREYEFYLYYGFWNGTCSDWSIFNYDGWEGREGERIMLKSFQYMKVLEKREGLSGIEEDKGFLMMV
jgi:hypothetical protein